MGTSVYNRKTRALYTEKQYKAGALQVLYSSPAGLAFANAVVSRPLASRLAAAYYNSAASARDIPAFVQEYGIDMGQYPPRQYRCFNDFFTRCVRPECRPVCGRPGALVAPADAKLRVYPIEEGLRLTIKGALYTLPALLANGSFVADAYAGGLCFVYRLTVDDCHRFCYIDDGRLRAQWHTAGRLHTVGPYTDGKLPVLAQNQRFGALLATRNFGPVVQLDVGALLVGRVVVHPLRTFARGQERGYFAYGGSTIVQLFRRGAARPHEDIQHYTNKGIETRVQMGEAVGEAL